MDGEDQSGLQRIASDEPRPISISRQPVLPRRMTSMPLSGETSIQLRSSSVWSRSITGRAAVDTRASFAPTHGRTAFEHNAPRYRPRRQGRRKRVAREQGGFAVRRFAQMPAVSAVCLTSRAACL